VAFLRHNFSREIKFTPTLKYCTLTTGMHNQLIADSLRLTALLKFCPTKKAQAV